MISSDGDLTVRVKWADGLEEERHMSTSVSSGDLTQAKWIVLRRFFLGPEVALRKVGSRWVEDASCAYFRGSMVQATQWPHD